jgi:hypothetical protein
MVVNHVILEIHHVMLEMHIPAFMYFQNYMADSHVILETCFTEILLVCNFRIKWLSIMQFQKYTM